MSPIKPIKPLKIWIAATFGITRAVLVVIYIYMMEASTATIEGINAYSSAHLNCEMFG